MSGLDCMYMNTANETDATVANPMIRGSDQPRIGPRFSASRNVVMNAKSRDCPKEIEPNMPPFLTVVSHNDKAHYKEEKNERYARVEERLPSQCV